MIRLIILDQGGLITRNFDVVPAAAWLLGLGEEELRAALAPDFPAFMSGLLEPAELWERVALRTGRRAPEDYFETLFRPSLDAPTFELVQDLRRAGIRVVAGTNTIDSHFRILRSLGHFEAYSAVYASHLMGLAKPDPAFWECILREEGATAGESFFADDSLENVLAARNLGLEARLFTDAASLSAELAALGIRAAASATAAARSGTESSGVGGGPDGAAQPAEPVPSGGLPGAAR